MDQPGDLGAVGGLDDPPRPVDVDGEDLRLGIERQGRRGMHHDVHPLHRLVHRPLIADVAPHDFDARRLRVVEVRHVQGGDGLALGEQVAGEVDAEKAGAAGDHVALGHGHPISALFRRREPELAVIRALGSCSASSPSSFWGPSRAPA